MYQANDFHWWQLITAHLYHYDWMHLGLNFMALIMLLYLIPANAKQKLSVCLIAIAIIDGYLLLSDVKFYAGFSGVNYALIGLACYQLLEQKKVRQVLLIIVSLSVYVFLFSEKQHQTQSIVWHSLKQAHVLGFISGLTFSCLINNSPANQLTNHTLINR